MLMLLVQEQGLVRHDCQAAAGGGAQRLRPRPRHLCHEVQVQNWLSNEYVLLHVIIETLLYYIRLVLRLLIKSANSGFFLLSTS